MLELSDAANFFELMSLAGTAGATTAVVTVVATVLTRFATRLSNRLVALLDSSFFEPGSTAHKITLPYVRYTSDIRLRLFNAARVVSILIGLTGMLHLLLAAYRPDTQLGLWNIPVILCSYLLVPTWIVLVFAVGDPLIRVLNRLDDARAALEVMRTRAARRKNNVPPPD